MSTRSDLYRQAFAEQREAGVRYATLLGRIDSAIDIAAQYGSIDGVSHKNWVIDQMVRVLCGTDETYRQVVAEACNGKDGPNTHVWDCGIAP